MNKAIQKILFIFVYIIISIMSNAVAQKKVQTSLISVQKIHDKLMLRVNAFIVHELNNKITNIDFIKVLYDSTTTINRTTDSNTFAKSGRLHNSATADSISANMQISEHGTINTEAKDFHRSFILYPNYPNPFKNQTHIKVSILTEQNITIEIFDTNGYLVRKVINNYCLSVISG